MAMDVVTVTYFTDCSSRATRIHFEIDIPVPPNEAEGLKKKMDTGDWNGFKAQAKTFAPLAISGALDFLVSAAPQKAVAKTSPTPNPAPAPSNGA